MAGTWTVLLLMQSTTLDVTKFQVTGTHHPYRAIIEGITKENFKDANYIENFYLRDTASDYGDYKIQTENSSDPTYEGANIGSARFMDHTYVLMAEWTVDAGEAVVFTWEAGEDEDNWSSRGYYTKFATTLDPDDRNHQVKVYKLDSGLSENLLDTANGPNFATDGSESSYVRTLTPSSNTEFTYDPLVNKYDRIHVKVYAHFSKGVA